MTGWTLTLDEISSHRVLSGTSGCGMRSLRHDVLGSIVDWAWLKRWFGVDRSLCIG